MAAWRTLFFGLLLMPAEAIRGEADSRAGDIRYAHLPDNKTEIAEHSLISYDFDMIAGEIPGSNKWESCVDGTIACSNMRDSTLGNQHANRFCCCPQKLRWWPSGAQWLDTQYTADILGDIARANKVLDENLETNFGPKNTREANFRSCRRLIVELERMESEVTPKLQNWDDKREIYAATFVEGLNAEGTCLSVKNTTRLNKLSQMYRSAAASSVEELRKYHHGQIDVVKMFLGDGKACLDQDGQDQLERLLSRNGLRYLFPDLSKYGELRRVVYLDEDAMVKAGVVNDTDRSVLLQLFASVQTEDAWPKDAAAAAAGPRKSRLEPRKRIRRRPH